MGIKRCKSKASLVLTGGTFRFQSENDVSLG